MVRGRIETPAKDVRVDVADVLDLHPWPTLRPGHDRAVFHFLTELDDYRASLERACNRPATS